MARALPERRPGASRPQDNLGWVSFWNKQIRGELDHLAVNIGG